MTLPEIFAVFGAVLVTITTAGGSTAATVMVMRRRFSRDQTEMTKDRTESTFMVGLLEDRGLLRLAEIDRAANLAAIARLEATNAHQGGEIARLQREFQAFKRLMVRLYPDAARFLESQAGNFQDTQQ